MLYLIKEDHVLMSMHIHVHVLYIHVYTCIIIHCTYYTYNVHGLCVSSIHSLIVCYLLHTHTQLLIDPRSSNEITNCCTSSLARICVFTGMVCNLYTQCGASTLCSLSPTHTLYRDPCSSNGLRGHCELMSCLC